MNTCIQAKIEVKDCNENNIIQYNIYGNEEKAMRSIAATVLLFCCIFVGCTGEYPASSSQLLEVESLPLEHTSGASSVNDEPVVGKETTATQVPDSGIIQPVLIKEGKDTNTWVCYVALEQERDSENQRYTPVRCMISLELPKYCSMFDTSILNDNDHSVYAWISGAHLLQGDTNKVFHPLENNTKTSTGEKISLLDEFVYYLEDGRKVSGWNRYSSNYGSTEYQYVVEVEDSLAIELAFFFDEYYYEYVPELARERFGPIVASIKPYTLGPETVFEAGSETTESMQEAGYDSGESNTEEEYPPPWPTPEKIGETSTTDVWSYDAYVYQRNAEGYLQKNPERYLVSMDLPKGYTQFMKGEQEVYYTPFDTIVRGCYLIKNNDDSKYFFHPVAEENEKYVLGQDTYYLKDGRKVSAISVYSVPLDTVEYIYCIEMDKGKVFAISFIFNEKPDDIYSEYFSEYVPEKAYNSFWPIVSSIKPYSSK